MTVEKLLEEIIGTAADRCIAQAYTAQSDIVSATCYAIVSVCCKNGRDPIVANSLLGVCNQVAEKVKNKIKEVK